MHANLIGVILCHALALSGLGAFELVPVSSFEKVRPESEPVRGQTVLALAAARNEREAGQVVIVPDGETLHGVTVAVSALQHSDTAFRIEPDRIEVRLVGYTAIETPSWRGARQPGRWPDPLLEIRPFTVPAGETRCLWITVAVPADAPAGEYAGTLTVRAENAHDRTLGARLHVWDFAIPRQVHLATAYWMAKDWVRALYPDLGVRVEDWQPFYDVFGRYRLCTDLWGGEPRFVRREDGSYGVEINELVRHFDYFIRTWRPWVVQVGSGCWGGGFFSSPPLYHATTGEPLLVRDDKSGELVHEKAPLSFVEAARLFYDELRPHIDGWGMTGRVYLQLWDEPNRDTWAWGPRPAYADLFQAATDIAGLCVVGIHPDLQGFIEIFCPHTHFADLEVYRMLRQGISLERAKAAPAQVTASSSGGWGNAAFYTYRPRDAYDGCHYTFWTAARPPSPEAPEWLQVSFEEGREEGREGREEEKVGTVDSCLSGHDWLCPVASFERRR